MPNRNPTFQPPHMIPTVLEITIGTLDAAIEQLGNMEKAKERPWVLDDDIIARSLKLYKEQNEDSEFFLKQCIMWKKGYLTELQLKQVLEIESSTHSLKDINDRLVSIFEYCKSRTIDKIMEKDDMELALEVLTGKMPFPKI